MARFLDEVVSKLEASYFPAGHPHPPGEYVSASSIVKYTAEEIAKKMIAQRKGESQDISMYWAYKGDALGDRALEKIQWQEVRSTVPIPGYDNWVIAGHCDGIDVIDGKVVLLEHKAHINATGDKIEAAKRQGFLYLSMLWYRAQEAFKNGESDVVFGVASWASEQPHFRWVEEWEPGGVVVAVARPYPPPIIHPIGVEDGQLEEILDFYQAKAKVIVEAVLNEDPAIARKKWDMDVNEFQWLDEIDPSDEQVLEDLYDELNEVKDNIDELEHRKKQIKNQIGQIHDKNGMEVIEAGKWRSRWVESKGRRTAKVSDLEEDGLTEYIKEGTPYRYLRIEQISGE